MRAAVVLVCLAQAGCITIASSVATPTALEHQLLGVYKELDRDLVHASSVRGDVAAPAGSFTALKALALDGRALQRFNEDDLVELKAARCIAEGRDGSVVVRPCEAVDQGTASDKRRLDRVIRDENRARRHILVWAAHAYARDVGGQAPSADDLAEIRRTYHRLLREAGEPGHLFEAGKGVFEEVPP